MASELSRLQNPAAVQAALDEFHRLGRTEFLERYGFGKSRDFLVRNPLTGELCDSKAIVGAAFGFQYTSEGPLKPADFSGGEATVVPKLQNLGFEVVRIGEDWTPLEVDATVAAYFEMLALEARQDPYNKSERNAVLRQLLRGRSKASVELKHQNISAVLHGMGLPFIAGYKPRGNSQLLLRKSVQQFILSRPDLVGQVVDAMEEVKTASEKTYAAVLVDAPQVELVAQVEAPSPRERLAAQPMPLHVVIERPGEASSLPHQVEHWTQGKLSTDLALRQHIRERNDVTVEQTLLGAIAGEHMVEPEFCLACMQ